MTQDAQPQPERLILQPEMPELPDKLDAALIKTELDAMIQQRGRFQSEMMDGQCKFHKADGAVQMLAQLHAMALRMEGAPADETTPEPDLEPTVVEPGEPRLAEDSDAEAEAD